MSTSSQCMPGDATCLATVGTYNQVSSIDMENNGLRNAIIMTVLYSIGAGILIYFKSECIISSKITSPECAAVWGPILGVYFFVILGFSLYGRYKDDDMQKAQKIVGHVTFAPFYAALVAGFIILIIGVGYVSVRRY